MRHVLNSPCLFLFRWRGEQVEECQPFRYIHLGNWVGENINRENFYTCYISFLHRNHETVDSMLKSRHFLNNKTHFLDDVELLCTVEHTIQILSWYFKCIETQKSTVMNIIYSKKENCQNGLSRQGTKSIGYLAFAFFSRNHRLKNVQRAFVKSQRAAKVDDLKPIRNIQKRQAPAKLCDEGGFGLGCRWTVVILLRWLLSHIPITLDTLANGKYIQPYGTDSFDNFSYS